MSLAGVGLLASLLTGCDDGETPAATPAPTPVATPQPTTCAGDRYSEVTLDAVPMDAPSAEAALAQVAQRRGRAVKSFERVPVDPRRYMPKVADRYASFVTRRADGTVAAVTVLERNRRGWTLSSEQTCTG